MAGIATIRIFAELRDLGHLPPLSSEYSISGVDEYSHQFQELAAEGTVAINVGTVDTVQGLFIKLSTGGTTKATGLSVDLSTASWAATDYVILQGEGVFLRPSGTTFSLKNLHTSTTAKFEYLVIGDNA